jgi:hypothetical protein
MKYLILAFALLSGSAFAQTKQDGNQLLIDIKAPSSFFRNGASFGYVIGIADNLTVQNEICFPDGVTHGQMVDVVQKYIEENPAIRHLHRLILVRASLIFAFPCKQENKRSS